jgi:RNA polymerase sigma-70 factor (ECF subfamily)
VDSYDLFYRENKNRVFAYLVRLTGDYHRSFDFMQESFTRYFSRYQNTAWNCALLYTIARNIALDFMRKQREQPLEKENAISITDDPEHQLIKKQTFDRMVDAIQQLDVTDRELIAMVSARTFTYREIGKLLNISEANVKIRIHRARLRLKKLLGNGGS